ncbi:unnamed protein product [Nesidiocoris tenuis]|uniref:beta-N-acetylhexosaminidase n=1 Tax=Nesidiocoris tenuis TaxID=355587 RepID=A0A6H5FYH5_9HEMI|nr:unnamed protein product [Nesidiocoris tenuis]
MSRPSTKRSLGVNVKISAETFLGARHGLETFSQLIIYDTVSQALVMPSEVKIVDDPKYTYRGILLDTARNFISVNAIKKVIEAMAMNKLNTFHWHITDSHSFPFQSKSYPQLTKLGAYTPKKVYTEDDIIDLVEFARIRGVRILPEFDAPAHVGEGWQWAGDATVCFNKQPWTQYCVEPPCGQLNPTSEKMYSILGGIYKDMEALFDSDLFHMGGRRSQYQLGLGRTDDDFHQLWADFQARATKIHEEMAGKSKKLVLWTSTLTETGKVDKYLDNKKYIIQIWTLGRDKVIAELVNKGFEVIFSNYDALYFDCGFGAWVGTGNNWCSPYIPWQKVYNNDPEKLLEAQGVNGTEAKKLILGSEATLWTEQADDQSVENRLWPRAAAMAEQLWSNGGKWEDAEHRFLFHRQRMVENGLNPDTLQPEWCLQNPGNCYL